MLSLFVVDGENYIIKAVGLQGGNREKVKNFRRDGKPSPLGNPLYNIL